jgi:hypothetical protein
MSLFLSEYQIAINIKICNTNIIKNMIFHIFGQKKRRRGLSDAHALSFLKIV